MNFRLRIVAAFAAVLLAPVAVLAADEAPATRPAAKEASEPKKTDAACKAATGTRIRPKKQTSCEKAANLPLRSYSAEELQSTGHIDLVEALRELNPAVQ
jgi:hypothetical protein